MNTKPTKEELKKTLAALKAAADRQKFQRVAFFKPYPKQQNFFDLGISKRERLLMAGNQLGKTYAGAAEMTYHLTGEYPDWWLGRRWDRPVRAWAAGESSLLVRDVQQKLLCGEPGVNDAHGTGMIPKSRFVDKPSLARGVTDAYDTIQVQHRTNGVPDGVSVLRFKSYEQGRTKFQGETIDFAWGDEEPPMDVYSEMLTRITATKGMVYITFTPLKGMSEVVSRYLNDASEDRGVVQMTIEDAEHIPVEERAKIIAGYPPHEREARVKGVPMLGSGRIFTVSEEMIQEPTIDKIPLHWAKLWAVDFGIDHPFAAVLMAWDKDADIVHVVHCIRVRDQSPLQHSVPIKKIAASVPVAWPQDGYQRQKDDGATQIRRIYRDHGLLMLPMHAQFPDGSYSTEAAIMQLQERMATGRLKVAAHLSEWFEEYRSYHRKDGMIVKLRDDLMSATQKGIMMLRFAKAVPLGGGAKKRQIGEMASDVEFALF